MTNDAINTNRVLLPNGSIKSIHGKLVAVGGGRYVSPGFVYVQGARVYGTASVWSFSSACFTHFEPRGKYAALVAA